MTLLGVLPALDAGEWARHPRSLAIEAYFDGWAAYAGHRRRYFPRFLTVDEEESWRDGWNEARAELGARSSTVQVLGGPPLDLPARAERPSECQTCPVLTGVVTRRSVAAMSPWIAADDQETAA